MFLTGFTAIHLEKVLIDNPENYKRDWLQALTALVICSISYFMVHVIGG